MRGRKRRNSEDEEMADVPSTSTSPLRNLSYKSRILDIKRQKTNTSFQKRATRSILLDTLQKNDLLSILNSMLKKQPDLKQDLLNYIPLPTILSSMNVLMDMEKKFLNSFPFNKNGPGRDDYTFSRVRENLMDYIDTIIQYANHFTSVMVFPTTCFTFLDHATHMAHRLPTWNNQENNQYKAELYQHLNDFWKLAIQNTNDFLTSTDQQRQQETHSTFSPQTVSIWAKNLAQHNSYTHGLYFTEAVHEFTDKLGYLIGLLPNTNSMIDHHNYSGLLSMGGPLASTHAVAAGTSSAPNLITSTNSAGSVTPGTAGPPLCHSLYPSLLETTPTLTSASVVGDRR
ncbi:Cut8 six-helix bundle-domain-containing protein [Mycotypha africana]|uniref:Cut8 six-helix bundle-domain-containing protein n=1 Tax=Mycotypha africana TaxID=64632 RepID=UPI002301E98E|nr:Cut8 six-helix bundle-domain-containing protein [Mycotypha africana]KAI8988132.1 Cut8 six-helix bundle-domain-containing protein [Mycotypha africana]